MQKLALGSSLVVSPAIPAEIPELLKVCLLVYEKLHLEVAESDLQRIMAAAGISSWGLLSSRFRDRIDVVARDVNPFENEDFLQAAWHHEVVPENIRPQVFFYSITALVASERFQKWRVSQLERSGTPLSEIKPLGTDWPGDLPALLSVPDAIPLVQSVVGRTYAALAACNWHKAAFSGPGTDIADIVAEVGYSEPVSAALPNMHQEFGLFLLRELLDATHSIIPEKSVERRNGLEWKTVLSSSAEEARSGIRQLLERASRLADLQPYVFGRSDLKKLLDKEVGQLLGFWTHNISGRSCSGPPQTCRYRFHSRPIP